VGILKKLLCFFIICLYCLSCVESNISKMSESFKIKSAKLIIKQKNYDFGSINLFNSSNAVSFYFENKGKTKISSCLAPKIEGPDNSLFSIVSDSCGQGNLTPAGKCEVQVQFSGTMIPGDYEATLFRECANGGYAASQLEATVAASAISSNLDFYLNAALADGASSYSTGCSDATWVDLIGGENGTFYNGSGCPSGSGWADCGGYSCLQFDGANDRVDTTYSVQNLNDFTIEVFFSTQSVATTQMILWEGNSSGNGYGDGSGHEELNLAITDRTSGTTNNVLSVFFGKNTGSNDALSLMIPVPAGSFKGHLVASFSALNSAPFVTAYLNGAASGTDTGSVSQISRGTWNTDLRIARPGANQRYLDGQVMLVRVYDRALNANEVYTNCLANGPSYGITCSQ
jgi:hypothetical protein